LQGEYAKYTSKKVVDSLLLKPKVATTTEPVKDAKTPEEATEN